MTRPPFERLLLATEHTEFDVGAERVAFELARRGNVPLAVIIPIESNPEFETAAPERVLDVEHAVAAKSENLSAAARAATVAIDLRIRRGEEPFREIVAEARNRGADLIVARRRGKQSFVARMMVGEMIGNVVREAPCSVLLVPRACGLWTTRILVAVDGSAGAMAAVTLAGRVAADCALPLTVVSVVAHEMAVARAAADAVVAGALTAVRGTGVEAEGMVVAGDTAECVAATARNIAADLIVAGRSAGHPTLKRLMFGSTAKRIVGLAECPVLLVDPRA